MRIETERLIVRDFTEGDAEPTFEIYSDPEVYKALSGSPPESLEAHRKSLAALETRYPEGMGAWAVELMESRELIGAALLKPLPHSDKVEIGWHLGRAHWGRGYGTEFSRAILEYGFCEKRLGTIYAVLYDWNVRSKRIAEKLGMKHVGKTAEFYDRELDLYSLTNAEYQAGLI